MSKQAGNKTNSFDVKKWAVIITAMGSVIAIVPPIISALRSNPSVNVSGTGNTANVGSTVNSNNSIVNNYFSAWVDGVKQLTGVNGKPKIIASSSPTSDSFDNIYNGLTLQTQVDGSATWELKSCVRQQENVSCFFLLKESQDGSHRILYDANGRTEIVDSEGNEYNPSKVQVGNRTSGERGDLTYITVQGAHYKIIITFSVPLSVSQIQLMRIMVNTSGNPQIKFRNIPINNNKG